MLASSTGSRCLVKIWQLDTANNPRILPQLGSVRSGAIAPDGLNKIEALIPDSAVDVKSLPFAQAKAEGLIVIFDPNPRYIAHLKELIDLDPMFTHVWLPNCSKM